MENQLVTFADDTCPRFTVACCILDYNTVCLTDKFGNISIVSNEFLRRKIFPKESFFQLRVPVDANDDVEIDPTGSKGLWDRGLLNGASNKVILCVFIDVLFYSNENSSVNYWRIFMSVKWSLQFNVRP
jgi:splicing factor 3B subunit 3